MAAVVAVSCVFGVGVCFALLGSIGVKLMPRLGLDRGRFGTLISALMLTCVAASLLAGAITDRVGFGAVAISGFVITSICLFLLSRSKTFGAAAAACVFLGFGAMAMNTAGNTMIPMVLFGGKNPAAASNLGNVFFGLGLFLTPLLVSFLFRKTTYEKSVSALGLVILLPIIPAALATYPKAAAGLVLKEALSLLTTPLVIVGAIVLLLYTSIETSFCNWLTPYSKEMIGRSGGGDEGAVDARAQRMLSLFAIAMMAGRLITSQFSGITKSGHLVIAVVMVAAAALIVAMTLAKSAKAVPAAAALSGLLLAPIFPTTVGIVFSKHPESFGSVFGIIFAGAMLGGSIVPKAIGNVARGATIQKSLRLLVPICLLVAAAILVLVRI